MDRVFQAVMCLLLPFAGTALGAAAVFLLGKKQRPGLRQGLLGFSAGVMLAAMVWSLLQPAIDLTGSWLPAAAGLLAGMGGLLLLDTLLERVQRRPRQGGMLAFAITLHNLPEGMAVGVSLAGALAAGETLTGALVLALGIAIQNVPEGAVISLPLTAHGVGRGKAFRQGVLSGAVEPLGAALTLALTRQITLLLPWVLAFAAGSMLYVAVVELIPATREGRPGPLGPVSVALGFALMMALDVALG